MLYTSSELLYTSSEIFTPNQECYTWYQECYNITEMSDDIVASNVMAIVDRLYANQLKQRLLCQSIFSP